MTDATPEPAVVPDEDDLRERLSPLQFDVTQEGGTEAPFTGKYWDVHDDGVYHCIVCDQPLFRSDTKFESGTGWPCFWEPITPDSVELITDRSLGMSRTEVRCGNCGAHLGHVFNDGPRPTGERFCMNSASPARAQLTNAGAADPRAPTIGGDRSVPPASCRPIRTRRARMPSASSRPGDRPRRAPRRHAPPGHSPSASRSRRSARRRDSEGRVGHHHRDDRLRRRLDAHHGIDRFVPNRVPYDQAKKGYDRRSDGRPQRVVGRPDQYKTSTGKAHTDPHRRSEPRGHGAHTYVISTGSAAGSTTSADHDELNYNVTGDQWPVPIEQASATVTLPSGSVGQTTCFAGPSGSELLCAARLVVGWTARVSAARCRSAKA